MEITTTIQENYARVSGHIRDTARSAGRDPAAVRLVVVTKAHPASVVRAVVAAGATVIGENYPEETVRKRQELGGLEGVEWHMIGHLQSRKSALVADHFDVLESLDSLRLADRLERQMAERGRVLPVLLELNVGGEDSKSGWQVRDDAALEALLPEVEVIAGLAHLEVRGLMTMPPLFEDPEQARPFFARLRVIAEGLAQRFGSSRFRELSMGTSADYPAAIQEGATLVRVGTAIVGPRPPKNGPVFVP
jgi:pyridoxal phosphate enzyme (YggS family)